MATRLSRIRAWSFRYPVGKYVRLMKTSSNISTTPRPRLQPISFFSMGKSGSTGMLWSSSRIFGSIAKAFRRQLGRKRWFDAGKKDERDREPDPDDKTEQRQQIHRSEPADAFGP